MKYSPVFPAACIGASAIQLTAAERMMQKRRLSYEDNLSERTDEDQDLQARFGRTLIGNYYQAKADRHQRKAEKTQKKASSYASRITPTPSTTDTTDTSTRDLHDYDEFEARDFDFDRELAVRDLDNQFDGRAFFTGDDQLDDRDFDVEEELALRSLEDDDALSRRYLANELIDRALGFHHAVYDHKGQKPKLSPTGGNPAPSTGDFGVDSGVSRRDLYDYDELEARDLLDEDIDLVLRALEDEYLMSRFFPDKKVDARKFEELDTREFEIADLD
ncbi:hypothetical protein H0H92_011968 [Tricholoma furcatifolium]|nr:hypothetical protein H0H92_011968 [Tricholoma furcatifolium]